MPDAPDLLRQAADADEPGDLIRQAREQLGWPQWKFGERLDLHVHELDSGHKQCRTLTSWESGESVPGWKNRKKLRQLADDLQQSESDAPS